MTTDQNKPEDKIESFFDSSKWNTTRIVKYVGIGVLALYMMNSYNGLVGLQNNVEQSYSQVQNVLQRQADLLPNLVETVKGYAGHESETFKAVTQARSQLQEAAKLNPLDVKNDPKLQEKIIEAQASMNQAMVKLQMTREAYPELKADRLFSNLMAEITGSQNRITVERRTNQLVVQEYNTAVQTFPRVIFANVFGYKPYPYFKAADSAQSAPKINFTK